MVAAGAARDGEIIIAESQTAGRGRYGRKFFSPPGGGVYLSAVLCLEKLPAGEPALITALAAVSVCEALEAVTGKSPRIKWVNDIFLDGKKICGILTETVTEPGSGQRFAVVGIGVNLFMPEEGFPEELKGIAGAVYPFTARSEPDLASAVKNRVIAEIINRAAGFGDSRGAVYTIETMDKYRKRLITPGETTLP